jgi:hypothetical protein
MTAQTDSLKRINDLKAEISRLEGEALKELRAKRESLAAELARVDGQIAELTGTAVATTGKRARKEQQPGKSLPLQELKALLENAPDKTLNIRKENLDLRNIKVLAEHNPHVLQLGGKGPWPTVTLLK